MRNIFRRLHRAMAITFIIAGLGFISNVNATSNDDHHGGGGSSQGAQHIMVHLGQWTADLHSAMMAVKIGANLLQHGAEVTLFLDREGVRLADKRMPAEMLTWHGSDIGSAYTDFVQKGGRVLVCPGCAALAGMKEEDLREGAELGTMDAVAEAIMAADKILDY